MVFNTNFNSTMYLTLTHTTTPLNKISNQRALQSH